VLPDYGVGVLLSVFGKEARDQFERMGRPDLPAQEGTRAEQVSATTMYGGGQDFDEWDALLVLVLFVLLRIAAGGF
jgi:hypothetical protein